MQWAHQPLRARERSAFHDYLSDDYHGHLKLIEWIIKSRESMFRRMSKETERETDHNVARRAACDSPESCVGLSMNGAINTKSPSKKAGNPFAYMKSGL